MDAKATRVVRRWAVGLLGTLCALMTAVAPAGATSGPTVMVTTIAGFGPTLVDGAGFALYTFSGDHDGTATCTGGCAQAWPPLTIPLGTQPVVGPGVTGTVGASQQPSGTLQVTYNGLPLYTFLGDTSPGHVTGDGSAGFSVVRVIAAPTSSTTTTSLAQATAPDGASATTQPPPDGASSPSGALTTSATSASGQVLATTGLGASATLVALIGVVLIAVAVGLGLLTSVTARRTKNAGARSS
jgi:predicted lipoprotein with Yx(FWY)xxD motif